MPRKWTESRIAQTRISGAAYDAESHLRKVSEYEWPKRRDYRIERAALWHVLGLDQSCVSAIDGAGELDPNIRPQTGRVEARYDAEAAIRAIPSLTPFTREETAILCGNMDSRDNSEFEHGIGDTAFGQLALCKRWHEWLWNPDSFTAQIPPAYERSIESQILEVACRRLSDAFDDVLRPGR